MALDARLGQMALFSHFRPAELRELAAIGVGRAYPAETTVLRQGDLTHDAYVVDRGLVEVQRKTPYGQFTLAQLGNGHLFGEASFIDAATRSGDAVTRTAAELLAFPFAATRELMERDPRIAAALYWSFWKSLSSKLRRTNDQLTRFFAHVPHPPATMPAETRPATGEFRLDIREKRELFAEQKLSPMEINFLTTLSRERKLKPGQVLFQEGDPGDAMYVVLEGRILISKFIPGAGEEALAFLDRGDYFGEMALIDGAPRSAQARAHERGAVVLAIPGEVVTGILDVRKVSSLPLLKILCALVTKRLRELDDKIVGWYILAGGEAPSSI
ncbi:MAG: cyclic nucleotide-binding domain-containing protein [Thermoanaerobaculia bacterium]